MSTVPLFFLNPHWLSGRSPGRSRCSFNRFSRTLARIFPAIDNIFLYIRTKGPTSQPPLSSLDGGRSTFFGFYHWTLSYQFTKLAKIFKTQLLFARGNKLFLCSLHGFNESKHSFKYSNLNMVTVGEEKQGYHHRGWGRRVTSYIWHSTDVRAEWPPFFSAARYMISPTPPPLFF